MIRATWLALVLLTACGGGDGGATGGDGGGGGADAAGNADAHTFCVTETNRYRQMNGKPAVTQSSQLETYADTGAMYDFSNGAHQHFISTNGGDIAFAENECPVQGNWMLPPGGDMVALVGQCVKAFYDEGPGGGHYENMMGNYATLGCGIYQMGTGVTIVQDYGH